MIYTEIGNMPGLGGFALSLRWVHFEMQFSNIRNIVSQIYYKKSRKNCSLCRNLKPALSLYTLIVFSDLAKSQGAKLRAYLRQLWPCLIFYLNLSRSSSSQKLYLAKTVISLSREPCFEINRFCNPLHNHFLI